jgi:hypothetical protein
LVGFVEIVFTRFAYAIGTSPATVTVDESLVLPPLHAASSDATPTALSVQSLFIGLSSVVSVAFDSSRPMRQRY